MEILKKLKKDLEILKNRFLKRRFFENRIFKLKKDLEILKKSFFKT